MAFLSASYAPLCLDSAALAALLPVCNLESLPFILLKVEFVFVVFTLLFPFGEFLRNKDSVFKAEISM